jgi:hypothetical protein
VTSVTYRKRKTKVTNGGKNPTTYSRDKCSQLPVLGMFSRDVRFCFWIVLLGLAHGFERGPGSEGKCDVPDEVYIRKAQGGECRQRRIRLAALVLSCTGRFRPAGSHASSTPLARFPSSRGGVDDAVGRRRRPSAQY